jgi:hypothetical protein
VKVIDMTGKEQRILSGYHAIGAQKMLPDDDIEDAASRDPFYETLLRPKVSSNFNLNFSQSFKDT